MLATSQGAVQHITSYLLRIPSNSANSLPAHVVEGQALLLRLDIPDGHKAGAATSHQDVGNLPVPVQAFDVVCTSRCRTQSEWVLNMVQV